MKRIALRCMFALYIAAPLLSPTGAAAQYYDQGVAPASLRWKQIRTPYGRIVFPDEYEKQAVRIMHYLDTARLAVSYGYRVGTMRMPVIIHTRNLQSNGLVMLAPRRMELIVPPPASATPEPWLKQLASHELRHNVQYNLTDRNVIRVAGWLLGDQGRFLGLGLFPLWAMEGDAVLAETELSTFGRGLQPSFTIDYRALVGEGRHSFAVDKWFCGSYRDFIPDHYHIGYQMTSYAWTKYGENVWDRVVANATRYPFLIATTRLGLKKYYGTTVNRLCREMLEDLDDYWRSQPYRENSTMILSPEAASYTEYTSPLVTAQGKVIAFKRDMGRSRHIVELNPRSREERTVLHTGAVNSPLAYDGGTRLAWSELRASLFWEQQVDSRICLADIGSGRVRTIPGIRQALFPTFMPGGMIAYVHYDYDGSYSIRVPGNETPVWSFPLPVSIHGLAWDDKSRALYFIAVGEGGMYIGSLEEEGRKVSSRVVKPASYSTINDLRASNGFLFFTSTQSGRDEAHRLEIASGREMRITDSEYGSFSPANVENDVVVTTYTKQGYLIAGQNMDGRMVEVPQEVMPQNVVNPPRRHWDDVALNMDSVYVADTSALPVTRFRKGANLFNFHSWAPVAFSPDDVMGERAVNLYAGVTLLSQNLLSSTFLEMRYAWQNNSSLYAAKLKYYGWAPKFELEVEYGGGDQFVSKPANMPMPKLKPYLNISGSVFLPIFFDCGYHTRLLRPRVELEYVNQLILKNYESRTKGIYRLVGELQFSDQVRMARRDLLPKFGYLVRANVAGEPSNSDFGTLWSGYVRGFLPGVARHHSLMLRAAYQWQSDGLFHFRQKDIFPRGADYNMTPQRYMALAADYRFPLAYPDGGISSIIYFKRVQLNLGFNYARYRAFLSTGGVGPWREVWSYGGDIMLDINMFRLPAAATNLISISIYKPSDNNGVFTGLNISLPI